MKKITHITKFVVQGKQITMRIVGDEYFSYMIYYSDKTCYLSFMSIEGVKALALAFEITTPY